MSRVIQLHESVCDRRRTEKMELSLLFYGHFHVECVLEVTALLLT